MLVAGPATDSPSLQRAGSQPYVAGAGRLRRSIVTAVASPEAAPVTKFQQKYRLPNNTSVKVRVLATLRDSSLVSSLLAW